MRQSIQDLGAVSGYRSHIEHKVEEAVVSSIEFYNTCNTFLASILQCIRYVHF